jgi:hypothetical protein
MTLTYAALVIGVFLVGYALFYSGGQRLIEDTPTSKVRSVAMGFAEFKGVAKPRIMLESPYSKLPCIYYKYKVEVITDSGKHRSSRTVREGQSGSAFYLDDGTGRILVAPRGAELRLSNCAQREEPPEIITEWFVRAGDQLYVAGTVGKLRDFTGVDFDPAAHYRQELARNRKLLADVDLKPREWTGPQAQEAARERLRNDIRLVEEKIASFSREENDGLGEEIAVGKGKVEDTFLISDLSEEELTQQISSSKALAGAAGASLVIYAVWTLLQG